MGHGAETILSIHIDATDVADMMRAKIEGRFGCMCVIKVLRKCVPGLPSAYVVQTGVAGAAGDLNWPPWRPGVGFHNRPHPGRATRRGTNPTDTRY